MAAKPKPRPRGTIISTSTSVLHGERTLRTKNAPRSLFEKHSTRRRKRRS